MQNDATDPPAKGSATRRAMVGAVDSADAVSYAVRLRANRKRTIICAVALVVVGAVLLACYAGLPMYAGIWHMFHGGSVTCGGYVIPVPTNWWAKPGGCTLVTPWPRFALRPQVPAQAFFNIQAAPVVQDTQWRDDVTERLKRDGDVLNGTRDLIVAETPTTCFIYHSPSRPHGTGTAACNVNGRMVVTFFYTDPKLLDEFYVVLSGIQTRDAPGAKNRN